MTPRRLFRVVAVTEAVTWVLLLVGMLLKYATETTELGVQLAGPVHGVAFIAYCLVAVLVGIDQRWSPSRLAVGLLASVVPVATVPFDVYVERRGGFTSAWRLRGGEPESAPDRPVRLLVRHPVRGALTGVAAVAALTGLALWLGPPV